MFNSKFDNNDYYMVSEEQWTITLMRSVDQGVIFIEGIDSQNPNGFIQMFAMNAPQAFQGARISSENCGSREEILRHFGYEESQFLERSSWSRPSDVVLELADECHSGEISEGVNSRVWAENRLNQVKIDPGLLTSENGLGLGMPDFLLNIGSMMKNPKFWLGVIGGGSLLLTVLFRDKIFSSDTAEAVDMFSKNIASLH